MAKMDYKAKFKEEEGRFYLHQGELQGGGQVLRVHLSMLRWSVGGIVSIDTLTRVHRLAFSPSFWCQPRELSSAAPHFPHQPVIRRRCGWSPELPGHSDQQLLAVCTLAGSADKRAAAHTGGQNVRLRRQAGWSWRRSKRLSAFYLQAYPTARIAGRADTHPDALPPGLEGASPSRPCEPMGATTIARCFLALSTLSPPSPAKMYMYMYGTLLVRGSGTLVLLY